jgi:hypothetical protein
MVLRDFRIEQDVTGLAASQQQGMGSYRYAAAEGSWQWSDGVYAIHGFRRGEVVPSTALLLAHAHSAERRRAAQLLKSGLHEASCSASCTGSSTLPASSAGR